MNRVDAKSISLPIVDRWTSKLSWVEQKPLKLRFVVMQYRTPPRALLTPGHVFFSRLEAIKFARATYDQDYALYAMTDSGTIDVTPFRS